MPSMQNCDRRGEITKQDNGLDTVDEPQLLAADDIAPDDAHSAPGDFVHTPIDRTEILSSFAHRILRHLVCDAVGVRLVDEDGNAKYRAYAGLAERFCDRRNCRNVYAGDCLCTRVLHGATADNCPLYSTDGSLVINTVAERERAAESVQTERPQLLGTNGDYQSLVLTRIHSAGRGLGLIHCAAMRPSWFTAERVMWLEAVATELGDKLFYDSLWLPMHRPHRIEASRKTAICPICSRRRNDKGLWVQKPRRNPRVSWAVLQVPRIVCPHCLRFCNSS